MKRKDFIENLETDTLFEPVSILVKDEDGFLEKEVIDMRGIDFEALSAQSPDIPFGIIKSENGEIKYEFFSNGEKIFDKFEKDVNNENVEKYMDVLLENGELKEGTDNYEKAKETHDLKEIYGVSNESGEIEYFSDEESAKDYVFIEKQDSDKELVIFKTLEPINEKIIIEKGGVMETKTELLHELLEELRDEEKFYEEKLSEGEKNYNDPKFDYIRDIYENGDADVKDYLIKEDPEFGNAVEDISIARGKIDEIEIKADNLKKDNPDVFLDGRDVVENDEDETDDYEADVEDDDDYDDYYDDVEQSE